MGDDVADKQALAASTPWQFGRLAWKAIFLRTWSEQGVDNAGLIAAGVAFYGFLSLIPLLGAMVLGFGMMASPETVGDLFAKLTQTLPPEAAKLIGEQLTAVIHTSAGKKGIGLIVALGLALFAARNGMGAIITALNVAYEENEKRGFIVLNLVALGMTTAAVVVALAAVGAIGMLSGIQALLPEASPLMLALGRIASYAVLGIVGALAAAALYRIAPSRKPARAVWLVPGAVLAGVGWLLLTLGFGFYASRFGNYNATYGSLSAVVVLLTWFWLSAYILILGAELNSECEHQTAFDSTTGKPRPLGERGAWVADHVAGEDASTEPPVSVPAPLPERTPHGAKPSIVVLLAAMAWVWWSET